MAIEASGVTGVITGKAVYTGAIKLAEAVALDERHEVKVEVKVEIYS